MTIPQKGKGGQKYPKIYPRGLWMTHFKKLCQHWKGKQTIIDEKWPYFVKVVNIKSVLEFSQAFQKMRF